jgi:hypothetical protein
MLNSWCSNGQGAHSIQPSAPDLGPKDRAEPVPTKPPCLLADLDPALVQQVLDVPQGQRDPDQGITARLMISGGVLK